MIGTDLVQAVLLLIVPLLWWLDALSLGALLVIVFAYGTAAVVNMAATMSFLPRLVPPDQLQPAHARIDGADAVGSMAGPASAALLVSTHRRAPRRPRRLADLPLLGAHPAPDRHRRTAGPDRGHRPRAPRRHRRGRALGVRPVRAADPGDRHARLVRRQRDRRRRAGAVRPAVPRADAPSSSAWSGPSGESGQSSARRSRRRSAGGSAPAARSSCATRSSPAASSRWCWRGSPRRSLQPSRC